ncbi:DUF2515 family protein [Evansella sp. AB-rgal1]|uniref:DUF2515 family protein n=1 Tax=Evansella sp. AB-rgal1 TaxID=3242696 RepID=UPI00359E431E
MNVEAIKKETEKWNRDNITRTEAYQYYYQCNPEIEWSYLASMVSRNAGWNMSDLWSKPFKQLLSLEKRNHLFMTYERANWMIFSDAYPQLLVYDWSKKRSKPLFYLLSYFQVSSWMIRQWEDFWQTKNRKKLLHALIINEQHLIQQPVIESPFFKKAVFSELDFLVQEKLHFSSVIFPTLYGDLYGRSVKKFIKVETRVQLGKELAWILLESPVKREIKAFFLKNDFTASRIDYQKYQEGKFTYTPKLKYMYPFVYHEDKRIDWSKNPQFKPNKLLQKHNITSVHYILTDWYKKKQQEILVTASLVGKMKDIFH